MIDELQNFKRKLEIKKDDKIYQKQRFLLRNVNFVLITYNKTIVI